MRSPRTSRSIPGNALLVCAACLLNRCALVRFEPPEPFCFVLRLSVMRNGPYEMIVAPDNYPGKRYRGKYAYEHRVVWWQNTGNVPPDDCDIHHRNENKRDNRFENLELLRHGEHIGLHSAERGEKATLRCPTCSESFTVNASVFRTRMKQSRSGRLYCSRGCQPRGGGGRPKKPRPHGSYRRYRDGCRCDECRAANARRCRG